MHVKQMMSILGPLRSSGTRKNARTGTHAAELWATFCALYIVRHLPVKP